MKKIFLIKCFDLAMWQEHFPIAFETKEEAEEYCKDNEGQHADIQYTWQEILLGKY